MVPVSRVFVPEKKLMKKYGTTTSELRAIEMQERREFKKKKTPCSILSVSINPNSKPTTETSCRRHQIEGKYKKRLQEREIQDS
jgi:hypothetical protein